MARPTSSFISYFISVLHWRWNREGARSESGLTLGWERLQFGKQKQNSKWFWLAEKWSEILQRPITTTMIKKINSNTWGKSSQTARTQEKIWKLQRIAVQQENAARKKKMWLICHWISKTQETRILCWSAAVKPQLAYNMQIKHHI